MKSHVKTQNEANNDQDGRRYLYPRSSNRACHSADHHRPSDVVLTTLSRIAAAVQPIGIPEPA
jgi:hypothetical protein